MFAALTVSSSAKTVKQYEVGLVHPVHYTTTTTTATCRQIGSETDCDTGDVNAEHILYRVVLADGSIRDIMVHALFTPDPLKGIQVDTPIKYRFQRKGMVNYLVVLTASGKEGFYGLFSVKNQKPPKTSADGPAPVN